MISLVVFVAGYSIGFVIGGAVAMKFLSFEIKEYEDDER